MKCDVLVIGAGPAGSTLAHQLARQGFEVRLADRKAFPRHKACGEFLSPQCLPYLQDLGVEAEVRAMGPMLVRGMHLNGYGQAATGRFRQLPAATTPQLAGFGIRRERFDELLRAASERAGAVWMPRHEFVALRRANDGRVIGAQLRDAGGALIDCEARWVIGADGVHSRVARDLSVQRRVAWLDQFALVTHFRGVTADPCAEVHLLPGGFFAATTVDEDLFSVNLVVPRRSLRERSAADWDAFVASHFEGAPLLAERLAHAERVAPWRGIGPFAHTTRAQTFPGAALVGDASGYVDPLTGEGIYFALFGARALGEALAAALAQPGKSENAMATYRQARRRELVPRMRASSLLQRALRHPWLVRAFLKRAASWPALADLIVTLSGDTIHPRDLLRPSFWRAFRAAEVA
ncbi:MAG: NAD(P)/FAD-dependent oxidoreductase [Planctomycetes bacterium]|jgi:flavin-dependent dehydrogenase|nr:NAD(P)/FAD-dependent oxidoreductase [Planctomycetota bacterium]